MDRPSTVPPVTPSRVASGATFMTLVAPASTRENTSRPSVSVPNQCAPPGRTRMSFPSASGSCGVRCEPTIAQKIQKPTIRLPATNVFERTSWRSNSRRATCASV